MLRKTTSYAARRAMRARLAEVSVLSALRAWPRPLEYVGARYLRRDVGSAYVTKEEVRAALGRLVRSGVVELDAKQRTRRVRRLAYRLALSARVETGP